MNNLSRAFGQNDIDDFEAHLAHLLRGRSGDDRSDLNRFLRANPGMTVRDFKGQGPVVPHDAAEWDKPWHRLPLAQVRKEAVRHFARELPRNLRQAAARDKAGLIWNELARKYRLRLPSDPGGGTKVEVRPICVPAAVTNALSMTKICKEKDHG